MTLPVKATRVIHTIHAVREMEASRHQYQDVLGGLVFSEGYEPTADRDMALLYVTDHMVEPMAPRDPAATDKSFAKWLARYGEGWHSFEIKVDDAPAAAAALEAVGCRVLRAPYPVYFFIHAESTGGILLEVCEKPMRNDPHDRRNWNPAWAEGLPSGLLRLDHIACVVRELAKALDFFTTKIDGEVLADERIAAPQPARRTILRIGDTKVALIAPDAPEEGPLGAFLAKPNSGIYALVWQIEDLTRARVDFTAKGLPLIDEDCVGGAFAIEPAAFHGARHEFST